MVSIAGSKGRIIPRYGEWDPPPLANLAEALFNGESTIDDAIAQLHHIAGLHRVPVELSVETNMICNLACRYCYLQERAAQEPAVSFSTLATRLEEVVLTGSANLIAMVGKEPLIDARALDLLERLSRLDDRVRLVMVTNGTLVERRLDHLARIPRITNIDVSLDGLSQEHDAIRGRGTFHRAFSGLKQLQSLGNVGTCFATAVLHRQNVNSTEPFLRWLFDHAVFNIHLAPVRNYTLDPSVEALTLGLEGISATLDLLELLGETVPDGGGQLIIDLNEEYTWLFLGSGRIRFDEIRQDTNGILYVRPSARSALYLKLNLFMPYFWKSARISHGGWFLSELDTVAWVQPDESAGNIAYDSVERLFASAKSMTDSFDAYHRWFLERHLAIANGSIDVRNLVPSSAGQWKDTRVTASV